MESKAQLRSQARRFLKSIDSETWEKFAQQACQLLMEGGFLSQGPLLFYHALPGEMPTRFLRVMADTRGMTLYFPRTSGERMDFIQDTGSPWTLDDSRIPAPPETNPRWTGGTGLLLAPALACDRKAYRLGHGGGYYDRFLASYPARNLTTLVTVLEDSILPELPKDLWDQPFHGILTQERLLFC